MADKGQSKALKTKFDNKASTYSNYSEMVYSAITSLKERKGSTRKTIMKYILATYDINEDVAYVQVKKALKRSVENRTLKQIQDKGENVYFKVSKNKYKQSNNTVDKGYSPKSLESRFDYEDYSLLKDQACELKQLVALRFQVPSRVLQEHSMSSPSDQGAPRHVSHLLKYSLSTGGLPKVGH